MLERPRILVDGRDLGSDGSAWLRGVGQVGGDGKKEAGLEGGRCEIYGCRSIRQAEHSLNDSSYLPNHATLPRLRIATIDCCNGPKDYREVEIDKEERSWHRV